jgi:hypothetical protein
MLGGCPCGAARFMMAAATGRQAPMEQVPLDINVELSLDRMRARLRSNAPGAPPLSPWMNALELQALCKAVCAACAGIMPLLGDSSERPMPADAYLPATEYCVRKGEALGGEVILALGHPGYGWVQLPLDARRAAELTSALLRVLPGQSA